MKTITILITILMLSITTVFASANVVINEINPGENNEKGWIELYNNGNEAVDLSNWFVKGEGFAERSCWKVDSYQGSTTIEPKGFAIFAENPNQFVTDTGYTGIVFAANFKQGLNECRDIQRDGYGGELVKIYSNGNPIAQSLLGTCSETDLVESIDYGLLNNICNEQTPVKFSLERCIDSWVLSETGSSPGYHGCSIPIPEYSQWSLLLAVIGSLGLLIVVRK